MIKFYSVILLIALMILKIFLVYTCLDSAIYFYKKEQFTKFVIFLASGIMILT